MTITVTKEGERWVARFPFDYATKDVVKAAGFRFDGTKKIWYTTDAAIAAKLEGGSLTEIAARINAAREAERAKAEASIAASRAASSDFIVPLSAAVKAKGFDFLPYQKAGIEFASQRNDTLIGDEMGLGKTPTTLGIINVDDSIKKALVVCPASLKLNWQREAKLWLSRGFAIVIGSSKPNAQIRETLIRAFALTDKIRTDSSQKANDVDLPAKIPSELRLGAFDASLRGDGTPVDSTAISSEEFDHLSVGIGKADNPGSVSASRAIATDPSLAVNNPGHVSENRGSSGHTEAGRTATVEPHRLTHQADVVVSQGIRPEMQLTSNVDQLRAVLDALESNKQISVAYSGGTCQGILLILNYDIIGDWRAIVDSINLDLLCCDEAHALKNNKAQRTANVLGKWNADESKRIAPIKARRRIFLTGTPLLNRPIELWTLAHAIDPKGLGKSWKYFAERYCAAYQNGYGWDVSGASNLDELQAKLRSTFMVRRLKADVLTELPAKRRQVIAFEPETASAKAAVAREAKFVAETEAKINALRAEVEKLSVDEASDAYKAAARQLREAEQVAFTETSKVRHEVALAKVPQVVEHLIDSLESEDKVVVMAHHHDVVDQIVDALKDYGVVKLTGRDSLTARDAAVNAFQNDAKVRVFVGSIQAAGVGLTLTASSHVIFAELDWVPGNLAQAEDRCHRIGQQNSVLVQHLVLDGSLDARMADMLVQKMGVIAAAVDEGERLPEVQKIAAPIEKPIAQKKPVVPADEDLPAEQVAAIHEALRMLAGMCDGARELDGVGFNKLDTAFGHDLARQARLSPRQAKAAKRMVIKYQRQLPEYLLAIIKGQQN